MGVAAFWIALAAVVIAGHWRGKTKEQMRHETVRLLIEKGEPIDQERLQELLNPKPHPLPAHHPWMRPRDPAAPFKTLRICATILMITAPGVAAMISGIGISRGMPQTLWAGLGVAVLVFLLGIALLFASRFVARTAEPQHESGRAT